MHVGGIRTFQPRFRILPEKKSFIEKKKKPALSLRAWGRWSLELRGLETRIEIKRGKEWATVTEIATTLFNWINNPCLKVAWGIWSQAWECQTQDTRLAGTEKANGKVLATSNKEISAGKPKTPEWAIGSHMSRRQPGGFPDAGIELTCSSSASRRNWAREIQVS